MCAFSFSYPACKAHAPFYIVTCGFSDYHIFPHYLIKRRAFGEKQLLNPKYVFWLSLQLLSETFLILRRMQLDTIINACCYSCKVPVIPFRLQWNLNFIDIFSKNIETSDFMKIRSVGDEMFHAGRTDGQIDRRDEVIVAIRNFANAPKNQSINALRGNNFTWFWDGDKTQ